MRIVLIPIKDILMKRLILIILAVSGLFNISYASEEVNLYSARKEALIKPLLDAFTAETGITVNIISSKADALLKRIQSEGINSPADVLLTTDAGRLCRAKQGNVFTAVDSEILSNNIPAQYRDVDNMWFGLSLRARLILRSNAAGRNKIESYEDLLKPEFKESICIRSSDNIYNQSLLASMIEAEGEEAALAWATGLVVNLTRRPQGGDRDQIRAAAAGQCSIAIANSYYLAQMLADPSNEVDYQAAKAMTVIWPNQADRGAHLNISGAGVLVNAPNKANGIRLIEFLVSDAAQKIYADVNLEYPVSPSVAINPILAAWGEFKADSIALGNLGEHNAKAIRIMDKAGWK